MWTVDEWTPEVDMRDVQCIKPSRNCKCNYCLDAMADLEDPDEYADYKYHQDKDDKLTGDY